MLRKIRLFSLGALAVALTVSVDLGLNYLNATFTDLHDGITCISLFRPFFPDYGWSVFGFFEAFALSLKITLLIALENLVLAGIAIYQKK